jgi:hypothetical protein
MLRAFPDEALTTEDHEQAAHWSNQCRRRGVTGSGVDFLILIFEATKSSFTFGCRAHRVSGSAFGPDEFENLRTRPRQKQII